MKPNDKAQGQGTVSLSGTTKMEDKARCGCSGCNNHDSGEPDVEPPAPAQVDQQDNGSDHLSDLSLQSVTGPAPLAWPWAGDVHGHHDLTHDLPCGGCSCLVVVAHLASWVWCLWTDARCLLVGHWLLAGNNDSRSGCGWLVRRQSSMLPRLARATSAHRN